MDKCKGLHTGLPQTRRQLQVPLGFSWKTGNGFTYLPKAEKWLTDLTDPDLCTGGHFRYPKLIKLLKFWLVGNGYYVLEPSYWEAHRPGYTIVNPLLEYLYKPWGEVALDKDDEPFQNEGRIERPINNPTFIKGKMWLNAEVGHKITNPFLHDTLQLVDTSMYGNRFELHSGSDKDFDFKVLNCYLHGTDHEIDADRRWRVTVYFIRSKNCALEDNQVTITKG